MAETIPLTGHTQKTKTTFRMEARSLPDFGPDFEKYAADLKREAEKGLDLLFDNPDLRDFVPSPQAA